MFILGFSIEFKKLYKLKKVKSTISAPVPQVQCKIELTYRKSDQIVVVVLQLRGHVSDPALHHQHALVSRASVQINNHSP